MRRAILSLLLLPLLSGCVASAIASTAVGIVTLPVKAAGAGIDAVTTSQSEADENRGRKLRKQEEKQRKEQERREREAAKRARDGR